MEKSHSRTKLDQREISKIESKKNYFEVELNPG